MIFNLEAIANTLHKFIYKDRGFEGMDFVVGFAVLGNGDTPIAIDVKPQLDTFLSIELGIWEINYKLNASGKQSEVQPEDIVEEFFKGLHLFKLERTIMPGGTGFERIRIYDDSYEMTDAIKKYEFEYCLNQFYCFIYYYDKVAGTEEYIYSVHLPGAMRELMMTGNIEDSYEGGY